MKLNIKSLFLWIPILILLAIQIFPIYVIALTSFKTPLSLLSGDQALSLNLDSLFFGNYLKVILEDEFLAFMGTSGLIALASTLLSIFAGSLAAYVLARYQFKMRNTYSFGILCARMVPPVALALPISILLRKSFLNDTNIGLIIAHTTFNLPFAIWLLIPFFQGLSREYEEAASLDGLTVFQTFSKIIFPLATPGLMVSGIFCFLLSWNDFLFSLILAGSNTKTAPLAINGYMTSERIEWGAMTSSSVLVLVPAFILCLFLQKNIVSGINAGGVKG